MMYFIKDSGVLSLTSEMETPPNVPHLAFDPEVIYNFRKPDFDNYENPTALVESITQEELIAIATAIDLEYTQKIFDVQMKHIGKRDFEPGYVIPQIAYDEVDALRQQCKAEILERTGLTDYTYRQSNPKLATKNL